MAVNPPGWTPNVSQSKFFLDNKDTGLVPGGVLPVYTNTEICQPNWAQRALAYAVVLAAASGAVFVPAPAQAETVTLDKWYQAPSQPTYRPARPPLGQSIPDPKAQDDVTIDKWHQPASVPTRRPYPFELYQPTGSQRNFTVINHPENETWQPEYPDRLPRPYPTATYAASGWTGPVAPVVTAEVVTLDKWYQPPSQPTRIPPRQQGQFVTGEINPTVFVDRWFAPPSQPTRIPPRLQGQSTIDPRLLTQPEQTSVDKWGQPTSQPVRIQPRQQGQSVTDLRNLATEVVTIDKWFQPASVPVRLPYPHYLYGPSGSQRNFAVVPETVTIDKWFAPASVPTRQPVRDAVLYQNVIDPSLLTQPEQITVDKFAPTYPNQLRRIPSYATLAASGVTFVIFNPFVPPPGSPRGRPARLGFAFPHFR